MKILSLIIVIFAITFHLLVFILGPQLSCFEKFKLGGYVPMEEQKELNLTSFLDSEFQKSKEVVFKQNNKLQPFYVRLNNQMKYSLFGELKNDIIEGKDGYLFEPAYHSAMTGKNFIGFDSINNQAEKLKQIIDYNMINDGPAILPVFAINKNLIHHDLLAKKYQVDKSTTTNYKGYIEAFKDLDISYIDFQEHFSRIKDSSPHPLTTKNGVHWSIYGALRAADSLQIVVGEILGEEINRVYFDSITVTEVPRHSDIDIAESLNLLQPIAPEKYVYPEFYFHPDSTKYKPNVLLIGDSFCWTLWGQYLPHASWSKESNFLYYFRQLWQVEPDEMHGSKISREQKLDLIVKADVVILLYSTMNLNDFGNGFINDYLERILPHH